MKNFKILILLIITTSSLAQELSQEYLDSLPETVRDDVLEKVEAQQETEKPIYRKASTMIDKDLEEEEKTGIFGEDIFDMMQSTFMPVNEPNFDGNYILDFGDVLEIQFVGQIDSINTFQILRDGSINIPEIGQLYLSGLSLKDAKSLINKRVRDVLIGTDTYVSISNVRDIQVLVTGNSFNPGVYTLNGNSNMLHAINMAGGVDKNGSYRNITLIRNNNVVTKLDLYDLFIKGKSNLDQRLRSGDTILVGPIGNVAIVSNGVNRPGLYEMKPDETFADLLFFANGFNSNANKDSMQIQSLISGKVVINQILESELSTRKIKDKDAILIPEFKYNTVKISGAIMFPGTFKVTDDETIKDIILRAGGYEKSAYPFGGFLNNKKSLRLNQEAKDRLYDKFLNQIIEGKLTAGSENVLPFVLEQMQNMEVSGRVIAEFDLDILESNPETDTLLEDGDEIIIPRITQQVYVYGEVNTQGATRYSPGKDINYYISNNGGLSVNADKRNIFIVQPNGATQSIQADNYKLSFLNTNQSEIPVYPGSIIYVPKEIQITAVETASIWGPIVSSLALSLTSLSVLDSNN